MPLLSRVLITIAVGDEVPVASADESYSLAIPADGSEATIKAASPVAAIRALETLAQLISPITRIPAHALRAGVCVNATGALAASIIPGFVIRNVPWLITDTPRLAHRGVLIDTSRHYIPVDTLLRIMDGMAASKLNVFHWHVVDSQSFPIQSAAFPGLSGKGAYSPWQVYTPQDVARIVAYGEDRGIRVIPELDMPGHSYAWGLGMPGLVVCANRQPWTRYCNQPPCGQLDLTRNETYNVVGTLVKEQAAAFPDPLFHFGSDEINAKCYLEDAGVSSFLASRSWDLNRLLQDFSDRIHAMAAASGKTPVFWEELALEHGLSLPKSTIIQAWKGAESVSRITSKGFRVIASPSSHWYLDCGLGSYVSGGQSWCDPFKTWAHMYHYSPLDGQSSEQQKLVIGGEVNMWTEMVDENNIEAVVFPRASAVAEVLWTMSPSRHWGEAAKRLDSHREMLVARGVRASPLWPEDCHNGSCL
ncbi:glycoside hydrolase superfamily [Entophlyctis helioformis]|nr:glycoside hydrolase superfamily [Entophlyctis helioformis]